jgi:mono/diheme cytochrome c family protein
MKRIVWVATAAFASAATLPALAADPKVVAFYVETCATCHGEKGEGIPKLAPAFKGNAFITGGSAAEISAVITKGRMGDQKKYKDLPSPMPPASMSDARLAAIVAYLKTDLQK